jgi:hypothetical protein
MCDEGSTLTTGISSTHCATFDVASTITAAVSVITEVLGCNCMKCDCTWRTSVTLCLQWLISATLFSF